MNIFQVKKYCLVIKVTIIIITMKIIIIIMIIIEQTKFTHSSFGKDFEKQIKQLKINEENK